MMDERMAGLGGSTEQLDNPTVVERSKSSDDHEGHRHPKQMESVPASRTGLPNGVGFSVRKVVDRFEAAASTMLPSALVRKGDGRKWSKESNSEERTQTIPNLEDVAHKEVDGSRNSEDVAQRSDEPLVHMSRLNTWNPNKKDFQNGGLNRAQSAREPTIDWKQHNYRNGSNKSGLFRAKSVSMVTDKKFRASSGAMSSFIADMKAEMKVKFETLEWTFNRSSSPMPILSYPGAGLELPRGVSKKSRMSIESIEASDQDQQNTGSEDNGSESDQSQIEQVALIVPTTDDPSELVWTFRVTVLGLFSSVLITFLNTYFSYRSEPIIITVTTVLIATTPLGQLMARTLPKKFVRIPWTQRGFSLNPGPFSMKEHGLITIWASAGSIRPGGIFVVNIAKVFFHSHIGFLPGFIVTVTCELFGYSWALLLYKFFVEPARFWWPGSLVNVSLVRALHFEEKRKGITLLAFFLICFTVTCAYYVLPGFFIPSISSVSVICLIFKHSVLAQQLGSGSRGLGLGALSFDWATITAFIGSPLLVPWVAVLNILVGFVLQAYVAAPLTYWNNWFHSKNYPIFSSDIFTRSGQIYNVSEVTDRSHSHLRRNHNIEDEGLPYFSAFYTMTIGFTFALFGAVLSHVIFFNGKDLLRTFQAAISQKSTASPDIHTQLMSKYPQIPFRFTALLFLGTLLAAIINLVVYEDQLEMKWWGIFLGTGVAAVIVVPVCTLVSTTNQMPYLGIIPQYIMGFIRAGEPITNIVFRTYSSVVAGRTATYLQNFKLGHYMKIPPMATFWGQLIGTFVSALVSMLVATWLTSSVDNICDLSKLPSNTPWTCPLDRVFYDQAVMFGVAGPHLLLAKEDAPYRTLNFYFLPGFLFPIVLWLLGFALPGRQWITLINGPLIIRGASLMPPSPVVNNAMWIYVALFFSIYVYNYQRKWWQRYNYVLSAALDAGTVVMALVLYYSLDEGKKSLHWWGRKAAGDHCPLASCPTGRGVYRAGCPGHDQAANSSQSNQITSH